MRGTVAAAAVVVLSVSLSACAPSLVERAIAARGGPLRSFSREVDAKVYRGVPGDWRWRSVFLVPESYRWTLRTYGEDQTYSYDGKTVIAFLGDAPIPAPASAVSSFRTHARWFAVTSLDVLLDRQRVTWSEVGRGALPGDAAWGIRARYLDSGEAYTLFFDERNLLVGAEGAVSIAPFGEGEMRAKFGEFRRVGDYVVPWAASYTLDGAPLFDERVLVFVPDDPSVTPESFRVK